MNNEEASIDEAIGNNYEEGKMDTKSKKKIMRNLMLVIKKG